MLPCVSTPLSEPIARELQALRQSLEALSQRVGELAQDNQSLREQLAASQAARTDLVAQAEHLIHQLALSRNEVRELKGNAS